MKSYLYAILYALALSFIFTTGWYSLFGYDPYITMPENFVAIYAKPSYWTVFLVWSLLYAIFVTMPITFLKNRATNA